MDLAREDWKGRDPESITGTALGDVCVLGKTSTGGRIVGKREKQETFLNLLLRVESGNHPTKKGVEGKNRGLGERVRAGCGE